MFRPFGVSSEIDPISAIRKYFIIKIYDILRQCLIIRRPIHIFY